MLDYDCISLVYGGNQAFGKEPGTITLMLTHASTEAQTLNLLF